MVAAKKVYAKTIRFSDKKQFHDAKVLAKKSNQSLNGYLLSFIDAMRKDNELLLSDPKFRKSNATR